MGVVTWFVPINKLTSSTAYAIGLPLQLRPKWIFHNSAREIFKPSVIRNKRWATQEDNENECAILAHAAGRLLASLHECVRAGRTQWSQLRFRFPPLCSVLRRNLQILHRFPPHSTSFAGPSNVPAATASHHFACLSDLITCVQQGCEDLLTLPLWFYLVIARIFFLSLSLHLSRSFLLCVVVFVRISRSNHKSDQRSKLHVLTLFVKKSSSRRRRRRKRKKERKRRRRMKKLGENIWWNIYRRIKPGLMDETRVFYPASQRVILEIVLR